MINHVLLASTLQYIHIHKCFMYLIKRYPERQLEAFVCAKLFLHLRIGNQCKLNILHFNPLYTGRIDGQNIAQNCTTMRVVETMLY